MILVSVIYLKVKISGKIWVYLMNHTSAKNVTSSHFTKVVLKWLVDRALYSVEKNFKFAAHILNLNFNLFLLCQLWFYYLMGEGYFYYYYYYYYYCRMGSVILYHVANSLSSWCNWSEFRIGSCYKCPNFIPHRIIFNLISNMNSFKKFRLQNK